MKYSELSEFIKQNMQYCYVPLIYEILLFYGQEKFALYLASLCVFF